MSVDNIPGTSTYTPTVGNDLAWQQAEEARRRAEQAAREAAERARKAAEAARKAADEARKKADEARKAAEAAQARAAKSKEKADEDAAKTARAQAKKDELDAQHKEAVANLRDKEKTVADCKVDDLVKHRPVNAPSDATVTAENEVAAAKKTVALYEPVAGVPAPAAAASAKTNDLLKKAQDAGKVVFDLQAKGKKASDAQVKAANDAVGEWLDSAEQDMRTAGASATAHGEDPNAAIKAEHDKIMKDLDDGGVFNPDAFRKYVDQGRDDVLAESPQMRELRAEQHDALSDGANQLTTARADAKTANADATRAETYAAGFTTASTDSQVDAQQAAKAEALRLRALANGADAKVHQLETLYEGKPNTTDPRLSVPGTVTADYDQRIADLDVKELGAKVATAKASNDQKTLDTLQPQLDQAINTQTLAHAAKDAADTGVATTNLQANQKDAQAAYDAAKAHQPELKTVTGYTRGGKYTYKVEPDGYDKTFWLDYNNPDDRKRVQKIDGKYYLVEDQPLWFDDKKTELDPDAARLWEANEQLANAKTKADAASTRFQKTTLDLLGAGDGVPGKLDTGPWLANGKKIGDDLGKANTDAATAQQKLIDGINQGASPKDLAKLRADVGTAMETQAAAQAKADALKAMQDLQDARRTRALGGDVSDDKMTTLENNAAAAYKKALDAQPKINADTENNLRTKLLPDAKKALRDADAAVTTARFDVDHCAPSEVAAKQKILDDATANRDKLALQVEDYNATLGTIDAKRAGLSAKWEYDHTAFVKPTLVMYADSEGNGISADQYPANYDPTWNVLPGKVPENAHVRFICDHWEVTFDKDSKVMGVNADKNHAPYFIKAGTYTMNPTTARVWETTNPDRSIGGSMATRAEDVRKNLDLVLPKQPSTQIGLDGKPTPTLNLTDDMAAAKKDLQKDITSIKDKQTDLQNRIDFGDSASPDLKNQLGAAQTDLDIANSQMHAIDTIMQWQEANRTLQQYNADIRAGKAVSQPSGKSYQEIADDLANKAVDARQQWLTTRDGKYIDGAKSRVADAQAAHDKWKADNPLLAGNETASDTWKTLQSAKADLDRGYRFRALDANQGAMTAQQAYITANLDPGGADDPHAMYRLFMNNPQVMAQTIINQHYVEYGSEPIEMDGRTRISNEVGIALGWKPSVDLDPNDPARTDEIKQSQDLFGNVSDDQKKLHKATVDKIIELGGDRARVTVLPVVYALDDDHGGIVKTALFKVERGGGQPAKFVDEQGHEYKDVDDYRANNSLPVDDVNLAMPSDGKFTLDDRGNVKLFTGDARTEGGFEHFRRKSHLDLFIGGAGLIAGVVLTVGSLGTLSVPGGALMFASGSLIAAGAYGVVTSAMSLQNQADHGVSVNPFKNEQARMEWVNLGLSAASIPVVGASGRALQLAMKARASMELAETAAKAGDAAAFATHMSDVQTFMARSAAIGKPASIAAKPLGWGSAGAMGDGVRNLVQNWDHLSPGERSEQLGMLGLNAAGFASPVFAKGYVRVHTGIQSRIANFGTEGPTTGTGRPAGAGFQEPVTAEPIAANAEHPVLQAQQGADGVWRVVGLDEHATQPAPATGEPGGRPPLPAGAQASAGRTPGAQVAVPTGHDTAPVVPVNVEPAVIAFPRVSAPDALTPFMPWMQSDPAGVINASPLALPAGASRKAIASGSETSSTPISQPATEHQQLHSPHAQEHARAASAMRALLAKGAGVRQLIDLGANHEVSAEGKPQTFLAREAIGAYRTMKAFGLSLRPSSTQGIDFHGPNFHGGKAWKDVSLKGPFLMDRGLMPLSARDQAIAVDRVVGHILGNAGVDVHVVDLFGLSPEHAQAMQTRLTSPQALARLDTLGSRVEFIHDQVPEGYASALDKMKGPKFGELFVDGPPPEVKGGAGKAPRPLPKGGPKGAAGNQKPAVTVPVKQVSLPRVAGNPGAATAKTAGTGTSSTKPVVQTTSTTPTAGAHTQPTTTAVPAAPVPAESMMFSTEQWATLLSPWLWNGEVNFGGDRQVYVVSVPGSRAARPLSFTPAEVVARGTIPAGATDVTWHSGTKADPLTAQTVHELFGKPADGHTHAFVVSTEAPQALQAGQGLSDVAWVRDPYDAPGVNPALKSDPSYEQVEHGHFQRKGDPQYDEARNYRAFGATKAVMKRTGPGASPEPQRFVSRRVATNTRRAPIPMQDLQGGLVVNDIHNHGNVFAHPHYLEQLNFIKRMLEGMNKRGLINDPKAQDLRMMISYEMIPYLTRANLGAWQGYTNLDVAEILSLYSHRDDWKILSQYEKLPQTLAEEGLPPSLAKNLIPSITGIPTYEGAPFSTGDQLAHLLLHFSKLYPMAGEINGLKELKSQLDGRTNRMDPLRSDRYGETGTYLNNALEKSLDAYRDAGLVTVLHMDYSAMELSGRDGRPVASPGDSRHFFNLMNVLMRLGSHDLSDVPYTDPRYVMTDAEVARIQAKGTVKDPLLLVSAHMGVGNWVRDSAQHAQLVQWASRHPLLEHVNWDSSWMPSIQALLQNPKHSGTMLDILASGRVFYGGDVTNFQSFEQLAAPWYQQQDILRALEQRDPQALRTYAGDGFRNLYEQSKPRIDWFRYRAAHEPRHADYIDAMPAERRADLKNFVANYERQHPGVSPLGPRPNQLIVPAGVAKPARLPKADISDPVLAAGVHQQAAHGQMLVGGRPRELMGYDANDRLILPDGVKPAGQVAPTTRTTTQAGKPQTVRRYLRQGPFNAEQLGRLRDPDGNQYTPEALQAADAAGKAGAPRSLQLTTLLATEFVTLRQNDVNTALEAQGKRQMKQILTVLGASGLAMLGGGAVAMDAGLLTPWVSAAALAERGTQGLLRTGHQQINRKVSEGFQEEGIVTQEMLDFMASRLAKWGPRSALDEGRFTGPEGLADAVAQAKTDLHYLLNQKINTQAGETQDTRHALVQSEATSWVPRFDRAAGATTSGIEPTNFRTPLGRSISGATALAYQVGFWGSLQGLADHPSALHATAMAALALGNGALSGYHLTGAVSGQFGRNLTELPLFRRLSGLGAYPALAVGNAALAGDNVVAGLQAAARGSNVEATLHLSQAFVSGVLAGATGYLSRAGFRAEFGLPPIEFAKQKLFGSQEGHWSDAGHVDKPRSTPKATIVAASGLIGLALVTVLEQMFGDDKKKGAKPGVTPGGPGLTPSPTSSFTPTPTPTPTPASTTTPAPTTSGSPTPTPGTSSPPASTPPPKARPIFVTVDSRDPRAASLWAIAGNHADTLLTAAQRASLDGANGQAQAALAKLLQINPQRGFRPELNDGRVSDVPGDPDTLLDGWQINVNATAP